MELDVGDDAVVDLVGRDFEDGAADVLAGGVGEFEGVHLEMVVLDGVGVVGLEGRAGVGGAAASASAATKRAMIVVIAVLDAGTLCLLPVGVAVRRNG